MATEEKQDDAVQQEAEVQSVDASEETTETQSDEQATEQPTKPPSIIRKGFVFVLGGACVLFAGTAHFFMDSWVHATLEENLAERGIILHEDTSIETSVFGGSVEIDHLNLTEIGQAEPLIACERAAVNASVSSFASDTYVIEEMTLTDVQGSFRRHADGSIPFAQPEDYEEDTEEQTEEEQDEPRDLLADYKAAQKWYKRYKEWKGDDAEQTVESSSPKAERIEPANWPGAAYFKPLPDPNEPSARFVIENLAISGSRFQLPDETPFDLTALSITGAGVSNKVLANEPMHLRVEFTTASAGKGFCDLTVTETGGSLEFVLTGVSAHALSHPAVAGDRISQYKPQGIGDLVCSVSWEGEALTGTVQMTIRKFLIDPNEGQSGQSHMLAVLLEHSGPIDIVWAPTVSGTWADPEWDFQLDQLIEHLKSEMGEELLKEVLGRKLQERLDKYGITLEDLNAEALEKKAREEARKQIAEQQARVEAAQAEAERKLAEEQRKAEEKLADERRKAEEKLATEKRKAAELQAQKEKELAEEQKRLTEEANKKIAEEKRRLEEKKRAEEEKAKQKLKKEGEKALKDKFKGLGF